MLKQAAGEIRSDEPVGCGDFTDISHGSQSAAAAHVLHRDRRIARNMTGQMLGENARLDVGGPAGGEVDDEVESLSLIEGRFLGGAAGRREHRIEKNHKKATSPKNSSHHVLLSGGQATVGKLTNCF